MTTSSVNQNRGSILITSTEDPSLSSEEQKKMEEMREAVQKMPKHLFSKLGHTKQDSISPEDEPKRTESPRDSKGPTPISRTKSASHLNHRPVSFNSALIENKDENIEEKTDKKSEKPHKEEGKLSKFIHRIKKSPSTQAEPKVPKNQLAIKKDTTIELKEELKFDPLRSTSLDTLDAYLIIRNALWMDKIKGLSRDSTTVYEPSAILQEIIPWLYPSSNLENEISLAQKNKVELALTLKNIKKEFLHLARNSFSDKIINHYDDLVIELSRNPQTFSLFIEFCDQCEKQDRESIIKTVHNANMQKGIALDQIKEWTLLEIESQTEKELFRFKHICISLSMAFVNEHLESYLDKISTIITKEVLKYNGSLEEKENFEKFTLVILEQLYQLPLPEECKPVFALHRELITNKFPNMGIDLVGALLFLRVINPFIINNIGKQDQFVNNPKVQKNLIFFTKFFQQLTTKSDDLRDKEFLDEIYKNQVRPRFLDIHHKLLDNISAQTY